MLESFVIEDDLSMQEIGAIEVTIHLDGGRRRWCYFMTPEALSNCGDWIDGTQTRFHYGAPYMIVVAGRLDAALIEKALRHLERRGELEHCSLEIQSS